MNRVDHASARCAFRGLTMEGRRMLRPGARGLLLMIALLLSQEPVARADDLSDVRKEVRSALSTAGIERILASPPITLRGSANRGSIVYQERVHSVVLIGTRDAFGAGAVISPRGDIITNEHVVQNAHRARDAAWVAVWFKPANGSGVEIDKFLLARVTLKNPERDLAVVRLVDPLPAGATAIPVAGTRPQVGQEVFTIGHPKAYLWSFAVSVVSQVRPNHRWSYPDGIRRSATAIQTQTPLNPGSSGGPLLNEEGAMVGVAAGAAPDAEGIYFAVGAEHVKELMNR